MDTDEMMSNMLEYYEMGNGQLFPESANALTDYCSKRGDCQNNADKFGRELMRTISFVVKLKPDARSISIVGPEPQNLKQLNSFCNGNNLDELKAINSKVNESRTHKLDYVGHIWDLIQDGGDQSTTFPNLLCIFHKLIEGQIAIHAPNEGAQQIVRQIFVPHLAVLAKAELWAKGVNYTLTTNCELKPPRQPRQSPTYTSCTLTMFRAIDAFV